MRSSTETLIAAMRILARDIQSGDGVANMAIAEAADRLEELQARISELESPVTLSEWQELERQAAIGQRALEIVDQALPVWDGDGIDPERHHCELTLLNERLRARAEIFSRLRDAERAAPRSDDLAVDRFAVAMKAKLATARAKGRGGWDDPEQCSVEFLAKLLIGHVRKGNSGNFEDIANLAMMLHQRGADPAVLEQAAPEHAAVAADAGPLAALLTASDAVIERWHTPLWKDAKPTAEYIAALRVAADDARRLLAGVGEPATVAVDAGALEALRSAMSKLRAPMSRAEYAAARAGIIEAAYRLLAGDEQ